MANINTNMISLNAQRNLSTTQSALSQSIQRLSSGLRVNSAKDDAAGLAIAERMNAQVRGMNVAVRNSNDGISMAQTAEGALGSIGNSLQRMRELAVQASNATSSSDTASLDLEYQALADEIERVTTATKFNGNAVLGAAAATGFTFQIGANNVAADDRITVTGADLTAAGNTVLLATAGSVSSAANAQAAITLVDNALNTVNSQRATWGAAQNRFEAVISSLQINSENLSAARGRIMDTDFASETANLSRAQVLQQAGMAMLSQANAVPQNVLSLLR